MKLHHAKIFHSPFLVPGMISLYYAGKNKSKYRDKFQSCKFINRCLEPFSWKLLSNTS